MTDIEPKEMPEIMTDSPEDTVEVKMAPIEGVEKEKEEPTEPKPDDEEKDPVVDVTDIEPD